MRALSRRARILASAVLVALIAFGASEALAIAAPNPSPDELKAAANAAAQREGAVALQCPGAQHARAAGHHYFTLAEAQQCSSGAAVITDGKLTIQNPLSLPVGFSKTAIVKIAAEQYAITRVAVPDLSLASNSRTASASGCNNTNNWKTDQWNSDTYIANTTSWSTWFAYCDGGARVHANWVSPSCVAYWPWVCNGSSTNIYNQDSQDAFSVVTNLYGSFCCSSTRNAWQEFRFAPPPDGSWYFYYWFSY